MITMLIAMRLSLFSCARSVSLKAAIIGLCLCLLGGCSAVRVSYNQGETLAWWWLDGYVDFNAAQTPAVKQAVQQWFVWHRRSQLPDYAALLTKAQSEVLQPVTAAQLCRWADVLRQRVSTGLDQAVLLAAPIVPGLSSEELTHIERQFRKLNEDYRDEYLSGSAERRLDSMVERVVDRGETLYGPLNDEQRRLLAAAMAASPFDAEFWLAERQRRQRDILDTLRRLSASGAATVERAKVLSELQALAARTQPPSAACAPSLQRLTNYNCQVASQLHNTTTQAQRRFARDKLKGYEDDVRSLTIRPPPVERRRRRHRDGCGSDRAARGTALVGVEGLVAVGVGHAGGLERGEGVQLPVHQVRRHDVLHRA